ITVDDDGPADFSEIDSAIVHASCGDTILVKAGNYSHFCMVHLGHWVDTLFIIGAGAESTFVNGLVDISACNFTFCHGEVRGFTFRDSPGGAGVIAWNRCIVRDCVLKNNFYGLRIEHPGIGADWKIYFENNIITDNKIGVKYEVDCYGIGTTDFDTNFVFHNNVVENNLVGFYFDAEFEGCLLPDTIDFSNNWWGTTDSFEIAELIYDSHDTAGMMRTFSFSPYLMDSVLHPDTTYFGVHQNIISNTIYNIRSWFHEFDDPILYDFIENPKLLSYEVSLRAFPNPFNSSCCISMPADATVEIFDLRGNKLWERYPDLDNRHREMSPTNRTFIWRPDKSIPSGIYLIRATFDGQTITRRAILIR
ncbi:right-handed parallel beta-helix repeat-containing protein, partial [bacterium]|nr:right-handed parallel beta-helix repeat-containing protein [bacterium]